MSNPLQRDLEDVWHLTLEGCEFWEDQDGKVHCTPPMLSRLKMASIQLHRDSIKGWFGELPEAQRPIQYDPFRMP